MRRIAGEVGSGTVFEAFDRTFADAARRAREFAKGDIAVTQAVWDRYLTETRALRDLGPWPLWMPSGKVVLYYLGVFVYPDHSLPEGSFAWVPRDICG